MLKKEDDTKMNDASFEYLYRKYLDRIVRYINSLYYIDADASKDIAHEVFKLLWEKRDEIYDEDERKMLNWLYETAKRKSWEYVRNRDKISVDYVSDAEEMPNDFTVEYEDLIYIEGYSSVDDKYQSYLRKVKKSLSKKEREMFVLIVEEKLDPRDVAAKLKIFDVNFRVRWHRLRNKLKPIVNKLIEK